MAVYTIYIRLVAVLICLGGMLWHGYVFAQRVWTHHIEIIDLEIDAASVAMLAARISMVLTLALAGYTLYSLNLKYSRTLSTKINSGWKALGMPSLELIAGVLILLMVYPGYHGLFMTIASYFQPEWRSAGWLSLLVVDLMMISGPMGLFAIASWTDQKRTVKDGGGACAEKAG